MGCQRSSRPSIRVFGCRGSVGEGVDSLALSHHLCEGGLLFILEGGDDPLQRFHLAIQVSNLGGLLFKLGVCN